MAETPESPIAPGSGRYASHEDDDGVSARVAAAFSLPDPSELPKRRALAWRVGDALRQIIERLVDTRAPDEDLASMAAELEGTAQRLAAFEHGRRYESWSEASTAGGSFAATAVGGDSTAAMPSTPSGHLDYSPLAGRANPLAPPMEITIGADERGQFAAASVICGSAYEGPPGCVHGGIIAAAFDEVMGAAQALSGTPGMTGTMTVVYRAPTPLRAPLRFQARVDRVDGRKIYVGAILVAGEQLCAEATGVFISVDFAALAALNRQRDG